MDESHSYRKMIEARFRRLGFVIDNPRVSVYVTDPDDPESSNVCFEFDAYQPESGTSLSSFKIFDDEKGNQFGEVSDEDADSLLKLIKKEGAGPEEKELLIRYFFSAYQRGFNPTIVNYYKMKGDIDA